MLTDVSATPIADFIRRLSAERRSGDLQVRSRRMVKIAFFDHGRLVFSASNLRRDRLGEGLVADGRITADEFELVSSLMRTDKRRFGEALVSAGVMDRAEVGSAVARQVRKIVLSLFSLSDGVAVFEERECVIPVHYMVSLSIHRLLYDGIRQMKSEELVLKGLGSLDRCVTLAEVPPFSYDPKDNADETEILELARRRVTVRRLAWTSGGLTFARMRATYALLAAGLLQDADAAAAAPQPVLGGETGAFLLSNLQKKPEPSPREMLRREVQQELAESGRVDRDEWLERAKTTGAAELARVLQQKLDHYHELSDSVRPDDSLRSGMDTVIGRLASALRVVRQAAAQEPASAARKPTPAVSPAGEEGTRPALPPRRPARVGTETLAAGLTASTSTLPGVVPGAAATPPAVPAVAVPVPPEPAAPVVAPAPAAPPPPVAPSPAPPREVLQTAASVHPDQSVRIAPPGSSSFEGQALIDHLLMEGGILMTVADYANAVKVYTRLVEAEPRVAAYHMRLATAMTCYPKTAKQAEREFYEAARLEPDNADIHYQWGLYYKMMKVKGRAIAELRNAVRLDPRHRRARQELALISPKDTALTSLKKLFR